MAAQTAPPPSTASAHTLNGTHTSNGELNGAKDYSVPKSAEDLFKHGVLGNPLIEKNLPSGYKACAAPISFKGSASPSIPINWRFAESAAALKALEGTYVNALLGKKYGVEPQKIEINTDHAQLFFMSPFLAEIKTPSAEYNMASFSDPKASPALFKMFPDFDFYGSRASTFRSLATNIYKTADDRYFHLHGSLNPKPTIESVGLTPGAKELTDSSYEKSAQAFMDAISKIDSADMDRRAAEVYKQAGTICYTIDEFKNSEHGKANAHIRLFEIHDAPSGPAQKPCWWPDSPQTGPARPLAGLKIVDMTRIIAAPSVTRGLAELGASVLRVTAKHLPDMSVLHPDLNWGKWNCHLDLREEEDRQRLKELILEADVFVSGYRPGVLDKYGFGASDIFELCKGRDRGIIVARENSYGWNGPWQGRIGWQQISDANTGVSYEFGRAMGNDEPVTPVFPNSDYCTGISGICAVLSAVIRRGEQGGSYRVDLALNYYNQWLVDSVGMYPQHVWEDVWARNGNEVFRHYHNMSVLWPAYLRMLRAPGAPGNAIFSPEFFEERECENLNERVDPPGKVVARAVKPILQFPQGAVKPGYNVGTRGNGADAAKWPKDLTVPVVR